MEDTPLERTQIHGHKCVDSMWWSLLPKDTRLYSKDNCFAGRVSQFKGEYCMIIVPTIALRYGPDPYSANGQCHVESTTVVISALPLNLSTLKEASGTVWLWLFLAATVHAMNTLSWLLALAVWLWHSSMHVWVTNKVLTWSYKASYW